MLITCIIFVALYIIDQLTKYWAMDLVGTKEVIPNFLSLELTYNKGAAWGMMEDNTPILVLISIIVSIILGYFCIKNDWKKHKFMSFSLTMALAGCVGNLYDRFISITPLSEGRECVVDMIVFEPLNVISRAITGSNFPIFNVADVYLVLGLIFFAIDYLFFYEKRVKKYSQEI